MKPLVSIIVPAYNIEEYIGRCIESLIKQTYKNIEIIVVDDGSNDNTGKIIDELASIYSNIIPVHKINEGVSIARNTGIYIAKGDYIGFVDGDDIVDEDMFEVLLNNAIKHNAQISHCGYKMVFPNRVDYYYNTGEIKIQDNYEGIKDLLEANMIEPGLCNKLYKKELFNNLRLNPTIKINEDLLINFYLFKKSKKSIFYDKCMYHYMIREGSAATSKINKNKLKDPIIVLKEIMKCVEKDSELFGIVYKRYIRMLIGICRNSECRKSKEYKYFIKEVKLQLKQELSDINKKTIISTKLKYMIYGVIYLPILFNIIDEIYGILSGNKYKYKLK